MIDFSKEADATEAKMDEKHKEAFEEIKNFNVPGLSLADQAVLKELEVEIQKATDENERNNRIKAAGLKLSVEGCKAFVGGCKIAKKIIV